MDDLYLVVQDEYGMIRPMAGIWRDNEAGKISSEIYLKKNTGIKIVKVKIEKI